MYADHPAAGWVAPDLTAPAPDTKSLVDTSHRDQLQCWGLGTILIPTLIGAAVKLSAVVKL